jgi:hypothetical protein
MPLRRIAVALALALPLIAQERPWSVSPCDVLKKPGMYGDTLLSVPGFVLYGRGQFTTHGYDCPDEYGVLKLEFGGNPTDPKDQFRLPQERLEAGTVPLKKDTDYDTMRRLLKQADASGGVKMLRATLTGRFFAGQAVGAKSGEIRQPNARLVISEVALVSNKLEEPADFSPLATALPKAPKGCTATDLPVPSREEEDKLQRLSREPLENLGYLADPLQVAARTIAAIENAPPDDIAAKLKQVGEAVALREYSWTTTSDGLHTYAVTVNRPYWLLPSTYSGDTIIWVPKRVIKIECSSRSLH